MAESTRRCSAHRENCCPYSQANPRVQPHWIARSSSRRIVLSQSRHSRIKILQSFTLKASVADEGNTTSSSPTPEGFATLERVLRQRMDDDEESKSPWKEVEGCWVLYPNNESDVRCLVHFVGGAFVGAAPQVAYRQLLESLASRGALVVATPYATGFDHLRTVDEVYFKYSRCVKALGPTVQMLPSYGVGHSLGSLLHVLMCSRYVVPRTGNVLMSFNNRPATDSIPFLSPFIAPSARALGPILSQLATSPLRTGAEQWLDIIKNAVPGDTFRQIVPLIEQLTPIYLDVANGTQEFSPAPQESRQMIKDGYAIHKNLLLKFSDDTIDETPILASVLQSSPLWNQGSLELTVKSLPGDHARPMVQDLSKLGISPEMAEFTSQRLSESESFWNSIGSFAEQATGLPSIAKEQLTGFAKTAADVTAMVAGGIDQDASSEMQALADEIGMYMGLHVKKETYALPPPASPPPAE